MKTFNDCCQEVAKKYQIIYSIYGFMRDGHLLEDQESMYKEAANMYAKEVAIASLKYVEDRNDILYNEDCPEHIQYTLIENNWYFHGDDEGNQVLTSKELFDHFDQFRKEKGV